jgi:hypothetical protein
MDFVFWVFWQSDYIVQQVVAMPGDALKKLKSKAYLLSRP